jgi:hypothetical protein
VLGDLAGSNAGDAFLSPIGDGGDVALGESGRALELDEPFRIFPMVLEPAAGVGVGGSDGRSRVRRVGVDVGEAAPWGGLDGAATVGYSGGGLDLRVASGAAERDGGSGNRADVRGRSTEERAGSRCVLRTRGASPERRRGEGPLISRALKDGAGCKLDRLLLRGAGAGGGA